MRTGSAVHVVFSWAGSLEHTEIFAGGTRVTMGPDVGASFLVPAETLAENVTVLEPTADGGWIFTPPAGANVWVNDVPKVFDSAEPTNLVDGANVRMTVGAFELSARVAPAERVVFAAAQRDWRVFGFVAASAAAHLALLGSFLLLPPNASAIHLGLNDDPQRYILATMMRATPPPPPPELGSAGGMSGQPAPGEEGAAGLPDAAPSKAGKVQSPGHAREPRVALTKESVLNLETLHVLRALVAIQSEFDVPVEGSEMMRALGPLLADTAGIAPGSGIGMNGPGRGGCPRGAVCTPGGTVGVGPGLVGLGGCDAAKFHDLVREHGLQAAREMCEGPGGPGTRSRDPVLRDHVASSPRPHTCNPSDPSCAQTSGGLSREQILRVVRRNINQVRYCYEQQLQQRPDLRGTVEVKFVVRSDGAVLASRVGSSTARNADLESCVAHSVERWSFPAAEGVTAVSYPFAFVPAGE